MLASLDSSIGRAVFGSFGFDFQREFTDRLKTQSVSTLHEAANRSAILSPATELLSGGPRHDASL
jgi:hypothetical protein